MKVLIFLLSVLNALPADRSIVQKSCRVTCSGKADNFMQYNSYTVALYGKLCKLLGQSDKRATSNIFNPSNFYFSGSPTLSFQKC